MSAYDTVNDGLNAARTRLNDELPTLYPVSGKVLDNTNAFTQQIANSAWRKMQNYLANCGLARLKKSQIITGIPVAGTLDPGVFCTLGYDGFFDGSSFFDSPSLPDNLLTPLVLQERITGQNCYFSPPMENIVDQMPSTRKWSCNRMWQWKDDKIVIPGATSVTDLQIEFVQRLPDFQDGDGKRWFQQDMPIINCLDSFAWYLCSEVVRGDLATASICEEKGKIGARMIMNRDIKQKLRANVRRQPHSGRGYGGGYNGPYGWC
jgi:hypothetical protein